MFFYLAGFFTAYFCLPLRLFLGTRLPVALWLVSLGSVALAPSALASGHGPVFGLATPTNPRGGWALDLGMMGRKGKDMGTMLRGMLSYGLTEDWILSLSVPLVMQSAPLPPGRMTAMMPGTSDVEGLAAWRADYPHWDWRFFLELTGERSSELEQAGRQVSATGAHQVFLGSTALGIYKNYAVEGGLQFPLYRRTGPRHQEEDFRFAVNFSYFF